jgi:hypothetical protein
MELVAHGSSRFCRGLCALQPTPSGLPYDPNMSEAENWSTSRPTNEFWEQACARVIPIFEWPTIAHVFLYTHNRVQPFQECALFLLQKKEKGGCAGDIFHLLVSSNVGSNLYDPTFLSNFRAATLPKSAKNLLFWIGHLMLERSCRSTAQILQITVVWTDCFSSFVFICFFTCSSTIPST